MLQLTTIIFLISFSLFALLHVVATELYLYWHFFWFDIPMHFFGGAIVALGFFTLRDLRLFPNKWLTPFRVVFLVFCVALLWELFEHYSGVPVQSDFLIDTGTDLLMGLLGSCVGYYVGIRLRTLR